MTVGPLVPPDLVLSDVTRRRLARQLAAAPDDVAGVVAETRPLPPGSSTGTHAEWLALQPLDVAVRRPAARVAGAVLLRDGVDHEVSATEVVVGGEADLLIDPGAVAHEPGRPHDLAGTEPAGTEARPPFRSRPVVLFLAAETGPDPDRIDAARRLVNALVESDVEARLAIAHVPPGDHLTQPCAPTAESVHTLRPDVVVALDAAALDRADRWCDDRSTVLVEVEQTAATTIELVSWRIGAAQGRLRARIGLEVPAPEMARLVNRLAAGPPPRPPVDRDRAQPGDPDEPGDPSDPDDGGDVRADGTGTVVAVPRRGSGGGSRPPAEPRRIVVIGATDDSPAAHHLGLVDQLASVGHQVVTTADWDTESTRSAEVLLVGGRTDPGPARRWIAERGPDGHPAVLALGSDAGSASELVGVVGAAIVDRRARARALRAVGVRTHVLPTLLSPDRIQALQAAAARRVAPSAPVVGWWPGDDAEQTELTAATLASLLDQMPDALIELVSDPAAPTDEPDHRSPRSDGAPTPLGVLTGRPQVTHRRAPTDPDDRAGWTIQLWSPPRRPELAVGDPTPLEIVEGGLAGVPTVWLSAGTDPVDPLGPEVVRITGRQPAERAQALAAALGDDVRADWSQRTAARAEARHGPAGAQRSIERLIGWLEHRGEP